jgi:hypothetical protein
MGQNESPKVTGKMDEKPQQESWLRGYAKFLRGFLWSLIGGVILYLLQDVLLKNYLPSIVGLIFLTLLIVAVVVKLFSILWKLFRPDDPANLSLK